ncbi:SLBB domain-containing protein [Arcticibacter sp.]|uniref:SLBB domain-containing protein n=1 Tax=Arcticibacter sp. TaxID=1872630 RepID=UPI00388DE782
MSFAAPAMAQNSQNFSDIRVDELSDAQIQQFINQVESSGLSEAQLEQVAQARGMSATEVQKLRQRVDKLKVKNTGNSEPKKGNQNQEQEDGFSGRTYSSSDLDTSRVAFQKNKEKMARDAYGNLIPKVFGSDLFNNGDIRFEPNLRIATPKSYIIGPDDQLLIDLTGDNEASYKLPVSPDGTIRLQYVGLVSVGGLSIEQATSKIRSAMSGTYPGLRNGRTNVAINLGNIRSIKITLLGEVVRPGSYTLSSLSTVFNALSASGGPNQNGSFRDIQVIRNNRVIATIDVYNFLLKGIQAGNVRLQDQDVINIPVYKSRVEMSGEVKRPALFEVLESESLQDVINFAGGFTNKAYTANIKVLQNTNRERRISDVSSESFSSYKPLNGDKFVVETILERFANRVEIEGAVFRPGQYALEDGLTLKQLIQKADGLTEDAFMNRGYISRLNTDNTLALLSFDVSKVLAGTEADVALRREDKVTISSIFDLREEYKVDIKGEVREPGTFEYAEGMTVEALIQMAGGFKEGATPNRIEIARRIRNSDALSASAKTSEVITVSIPSDLKLQSTPILLQPFDIVSIRNSQGYQIQQQVRVEGEVLYPGIYTITRKDERISDIIKRAGGLTALSFVEGASLKRPGVEDDTKSGSKDASESKEEEMQKLANLKRLQGQGVQDTAQVVQDVKAVGSDLVGIDLKRILKKPASKFDLILEDGDIIRVPKQLQTVKVTGEVLRPINIVYRPGRSMKQYINGAGGYTYNANKRGAYIQYANGSVDAVSKVLFFSNYPPVKPGAEVFVPKRAPREKMNVQGWIGIGTAAASLAAIIVSLFTK